MEIVDLIKGIGDETRIRIINIVSKGEHCVCDIEEILGLTQSNASRHLNKLKSLKIITAEKKAQWVHYKFNNEILKRYPFIELLINKNFNNEILKRDLKKRLIYLNKKNKC